MRKYNLLSFIGVILLIGVLTSCNDYLKESSDDLLIPKKVDEFASVLQGDGYPNTLTEDIEWMDLMTDDAEVSPSANPNSTQADGDDNVYLPVGRGAFTWAQDIEYYDTSYGKTYLNRYRISWHAILLLKMPTQCKATVWKLIHAWLRLMPCVR